MNLATELLKSIIKTKTTPRPKGMRIESMVKTAVMTELNAMRKLSRPMDAVTAQHLATQRIRHIKWAQAR